jgi:hypothetical protein
MGVSPSKKAKNDPIDVDDFDFDDGVDNKDFEEETHELKVSCLKPVKPEIMTGMKPSNLKSAFACYHGKSRRIKRSKERKRATKRRYSTRGKG